MSKNAQKTPKTRPAIDAEILGAMLSAQDDTFRELLPLAAAEIPGLMAEAFDAPRSAKPPSGLALQAKQP